MGLPIPDALPSLIAALAPGGPGWGKAAFIGVFVLLLIWLLVLPAGLIGNHRKAVPWWRSARLWAIAVVLCQIAIYFVWG